MEALPQPLPLRETALKEGERVIYPNQGVCRISGIEVKEIGGIRAEFLTMKREEDGATVMIPRAKVATIGLRHVAARSEIEAVLHLLEDEGEDPELDWKVRHRTHADKMVTGSLLGTAQVLKGLHSLALLRPLPQRERELYDSARHLLIHEIAVSLGQSACTAEDTLDLCLTPIAGSPRAEAQARRIALALEEAPGLDADLDAEAPAEEEAEEEAEAPAPVVQPPKAAPKSRPTAKAAAAPRAAAKIPAKVPAKKAAKSAAPRVTTKSKVAPKTAPKKTAPKATPTRLAKAKATRKPKQKGRK